MVIFYLWKPNFRQNEKTRSERFVSGRFRLAGRWMGSMSNDIIAHDIDPRFWQKPHFPTVIFFSLSQFFRLDFFFIGLKNGSPLMGTKKFFFPGLNPPHFDFWFCQMSTGYSRYICLEYSINNQVKSWKSFPFNRTPSVLLKFWARGSGLVWVRTWDWTRTEQERWSLSNFWHFNSEH